MKLLTNEPALQLLPNLAVKLGLNEAIVLQQLHYRLQHSPLKYDGHVWYCHAYKNWHKQFPFWSEKTIHRVFLRLEQQGLIVATQKYNEMKVNKTKWYRIDYEALSRALGGQPGESAETSSLSTPEQIANKAMDNSLPSVLKELKKEEKKDFIYHIIGYLNAKANKSFRVDHEASIQLILERLKEGYTLQDFKQVIDVKVGQWQFHEDMKRYLRPLTLFSAANFAKYLQEAQASLFDEAHPGNGPIMLDFEAGEAEEEDL